jgi:hypothetical protein
MSEDQLRSGPEPAPGYLSNSEYQQGARHQGSGEGNYKGCNEYKRKSSFWHSLSIARKSRVLNDIVEAPILTDKQWIGRYRWVVNMFSEY